MRQLLLMYMNGWSSFHLIIQQKHIPRDREESEKKALYHGNSKASGFLKRMDIWEHVSDQEHT